MLLLEERGGRLNLIDQHVQQKPEYSTSIPHLSTYLKTPTPKEPLTGEQRSSLMYHLSPSPSPRTHASTTDPSLAAYSRPARPSTVQFSHIAAAISNSAGVPRHPSTRPWYLALYPQIPRWDQQDPRLYKQEAAIETRRTNQ